MTNDNNLNKGSFSRDDLNNRPPRKTTTRSTADRTRGTAKPTVKKTVNKTQKNSRIMKSDKPAKVKAAVPYQKEWHLLPRRPESLLRKMYKSTLGKSPILPPDKLCRTFNCSSHAPFTKRPSGFCVTFLLFLLIYTLHLL